MEPIIVFLTTWWWAAPAAAGLGIVGYTGLTTNRRRSRRLALDAARHEEQLALQQVFDAQANTRAAQAQLLSAQAAKRGGVAVPGGAAVAEARRLLALAKHAQRTAGMTLKASRANVRAERIRIHSISGTDDLPLARLMREHDTVTARWLEYETDLESALAFPDMTDPHRPATAAFLTAQQEAMRLRPSTTSAKMTGEQFADYRAAIRRAEAAFDAAEDAALRASADRGTLPRRSEGPPTGQPKQGSTVWPVPRRDQRPPQP